ncbi:MAG: ATP-binding cassette domain-containing protein [Eubacteriales bacterium]
MPEKKTTDNAVIPETVTDMKSDPTTGEVLLRVEHLSQHFGRLKAVDDVSFEVKRGEVFGLVGESGCGKTTTGRSIIKLYDITGGSVYFKGRRIAAGILEYRNEIKRLRAEAQEKIDLLKAGDDPEKEEKIKQCKAELREKVAAERAKMRAARDDHRHCEKKYLKDKTQEAKAAYEEALKTLPVEEHAKAKEEYDRALKELHRQKLVTQIQMIFQDPIASLDPRMTVQEIISEGLVIHGVKDKKYISEKVYEVLDTVGLVPEHAGRYPHEFSGGQRQRIGVARAVIMNPELIIADEPVSALDVSVQAQVINLLDDLRHKMGLTILFIAHDLSVVKYFSDRIGVMYYGKMVELATSDELFRHPLHPYTRALLSAIPLPDPEYEKKRKRITYEPLREHDYTVEKPSMREVAPGHFVWCNTPEEQKYKEELGL